MTTDVISIPVKKCRDNNAAIAAMTQSTDACVKIINDTYKTSNNKMFLYAAAKSSAVAKSTETFAVCLEKGTVIVLEKLTINQARDLVYLRVKAAGVENPMFHNVQIVTSTTGCESIDNIERIDEKRARALATASLKRFKHHIGSKAATAILASAAKTIKDMSIDEFEKLFKSNMMNPHMAGHQQTVIDEMAATRRMLALAKTAICEKLVGSKQGIRARRGSRNIDVSDMISVELMSKAMIEYYGAPWNSDKAMNVEPFLEVTVTPDKFSTRVMYTSIRIGVRGEFTAGVGKNQHTYTSDIQAMQAYIMDP